MVERSLEVMRDWVDAWNRGDLDAFAHLFDADADVITDPSWAEAGPFKGRAEIRAWYEGLKDSWGGRDQVVVSELFEVAGKVVLRLDWRVRGRASGIEMQLDATGVHTIEGGKIVRQQWYFDHAAALKAVGTRQEKQQPDR
jgi:ketosteroid isomerase-like protein